MIPYDQLPTGWFFEEDVAAYRWAYEQLVPEGGHTTEVGVYYGRSLVSVSDIIERKRINVAAVDNFGPVFGEYDGMRLLRVMKHIEICRLHKQVAICVGDSLTVVRAVEDHSLDLVFIDADHHYEAVKADIEAWEPKIKPKGWIGGHDYSENDPGVIAAVDERYGHPHALQGWCWFVQL